MDQIITVKEARKILGKDADSMSNHEIAEVIETLHLMANDSLNQAKHKFLMHMDALALANVIYDIYQEQK